MSLFFIASVSGPVWAQYMLNEYIGSSGRPVHVSGCIATSAAAVQQGSYKFFGTCGQNTIQLVSRDTSEGRVQIMPGFLMTVKNFVLSFLQSVPYMREIFAQYDAADATPIHNNYPTNHPTPYFYWDVPNSRSPVVQYAYRVIDAEKKEITSGTSGVEYLDIEIVDNGTYALHVKALNQSGNWGDEGTFAYIYDTDGPEPVDYFTLQSWGDKYFHPLLIKLEFPFTEYLDENRVNSSTMKLDRQKWDTTWEAVNGGVSYNNDNQALIFSPDESLDAMASYKIDFKNVCDLAGNSFTGQIFFKTYIGAAMQAELYSDDGAVTLSIPHWGFKKDALVMVTRFEHEDELVSKADRKAELKLNTILCDSNVYKVEILDLKFRHVDSFNKEAGLSFIVPDADNDGIWDNTDIRIKDIALARLDEEKKDWCVVEQKDTAELEKAVGRPLSRSISVPIKKAVYYRLLSFLAPGNSIDNVIVYPNPFRPGQGHTEVTFLRLPADATIDLYNLAGERIRHFPASDQGQLLWDGTNSRGMNVASGVYIALIRSNGAKKTYKIAIER